MKVSFLNQIESTPRTLLFYYAILVQLTASAISGTGFVLNNGLYYIIGTLVWTVWFILIFIILRPETDLKLTQHDAFLKRSAFSIFTGLFILGIAEVIIISLLLPIYLKNARPEAPFTQLMVGLDHVFEYNDGTALAQQATENLLAGKNPYAHANVVTALLEFNGAYDRVTPLRKGSFAGVFPYPSTIQLQNLWNQIVNNPSQPVAELESKVCYPSGSFLLPAPFIAAGIKDIRLVYTIFVLAGLCYAVSIIPKKKRLLFVGAAVISLELWNSIAGGETGSLVFPLLLIAWLSVRRNLWLSTILMGLAVCTKQTAWFFLPFYLILIMRQYSTAKAVFVTVGVAAIFCVLNLPFIAADPNLWISSISSPMLDPMFPVGSGIVTLVIAGVLNIHSSLIFTILEMLIWLASSVWYFMYCRRYPRTGPILAVLPLFFAWRSMWCYFFYVALISLADILANEKNSVVNILPIDSAGNTSAIIS